MKIVQSKERIMLSECEKCLLEKAHDLLNNIFEEADDSDIYNLADEATKAIDELLEEYCD